MTRCLAWLSAATVYLNDKGCSLRQKQYSFIEEDLSFFPPSDVAFSWMLSYFLNKSAPKEKVLSLLLCQNTAEETNNRVDVLRKFVQEEPTFVLQHKAINDSLRQKEYGLLAVLDHLAIWAHGLSRAGIPWFECFNQIIFRSLRSGIPHPLTIYFFSSESPVLAFVFHSLLLSIHWGPTVMNTLRSLSICYFGNTFCSPSVFLIKFIHLYYLA